MSPGTRRARPGGFSLVELLVAMTLGLIVLTGTVAVFAGNRSSSELNTAMANLQENARFALETMTADARMAGFQGCIDVNKGRLNTVAATPPTTDLRLTATRGSLVQASDSWSPNPPTGFVPADDDPFPSVPGTHALSLQFGGPATARLSGQMSDGTGNPAPGAALPLDPATTAADIGLAVGDYAIVSNCDTGDLFRVTGTNPAGTLVRHQQVGTNTNTSGALTLAYGDDRTRGQTMVMEFHSNIYFVGDTGLTNEAGDTVTALYRQTLPYTAANPPTELVQGVENMRVTFGVRTDTGSLRYVAPGAAGYDPARVEALRIGLLMTSWGRISEDEDERTYLLAGQPIVASDDASNPNAHPRDRRMRLAFNTTVRVRNRRDPS